MTRQVSRLAPVPLLVKSSQPQTVVGQSEGFTIGQHQETLMRSIATKYSWAWVPDRFFNPTNIPIALCSALDTDLTFLVGASFANFRLPWLMTKGADRLQVDLLIAATPTLFKLKVRTAVNTMVTAITQTYSPYVDVSLVAPVMQGPWFRSNNLWEVGRIRTEIEYPSAPADRKVVIEAFAHWESNGSGSAAGRAHVIAAHAQDLLTEPTEI